MKINFTGSRTSASFAMIVGCREERRMIRVDYDDERDGDGGNDDEYGDYYDNRNHRFKNVCKLCNNGGMQR